MKIPAVKNKQIQNLKTNFSLKISNENANLNSNFNEITNRFDNLLKIKNSQNVLLTDFKTSTKTFLIEQNQLINQFKQSKKQFLIEINSLIDEYLNLLKTYQIVVTKIKKYDQIDSTEIVQIEKAVKEFQIGAKKINKVIYF